MTIEVVDADITLLDVDAVVNAANDHLWMGSGVAGAIKQVGGVGSSRRQSLWDRSPSARPRARGVDVITPNPFTSGRRSGPLRQT